MPSILRIVLLLMLLLSSGVSWSQPRAAGERTLGVQAAMWRLLEQAGFEARLWLDQDNELIRSACAAARRSYS